MPLTFVVPCISFVDVTASLVHGWRHRRHTAWDEVLTVLPFTILGVVLALYLLKSLDTSILANALGIFVLLFALYSLVGPTLKHQCSVRWSITAGSPGGIFIPSITRRRFQRAIGILLIISGITLLAKSS